MPTQEQYEESEVGKLEAERIGKGLSEFLNPPNPDDIYLVHCPSCGFFGMNDDCKHSECPNCGKYVVKDRG